ncbi:MAG: hypothetical protein ABIJ53_04240 [Verrucomicrobiota bacterium]
MPRQIFMPAVGHWSRCGLAAWLVKQLRSEERLLVGIDHAFSFPNIYMQRYGLGSWDDFLRDFHEHWPTDQKSVETCRPDNKRIGSPREYRLTDQWTSSAKSVFLFDVNGSVAKSTHAGLPWLLHIRKSCGDSVHFWPFDGFDIPEGRSVVAEVYPSLFRNRYLRDDRSSTDEQDAYATARWMKEMAAAGFLTRYFDPPLTKDQRVLACLEGWILGVN